MIHHLVSVFNSPLRKHDSSLQLSYPWKEILTTKIHHERNRAQAQDEPSWVEQVKHCAIGQTVNGLPNVSTIQHRAVMSLTFASHRSVLASSGAVNMHYSHNRCTVLVWFLNSEFGKSCFMMSPLRSNYCEIENSKFDINVLKRLIHNLRKTVLHQFNWGYSYYPFEPTLNVTCTLFRALYVMIRVLSGCSY